MNTQQIIADIELVRDILTLDASPARKSAAAVLLRAAADALEGDAIEAQSEPESKPALRPLKRGEAIQAGDIYKALDGKIYQIMKNGGKYDPNVHCPHFRPTNP